MKPGKTGMGRLLGAAQYSVQGLNAAWKNEAAFRQELYLVLVLTPLAILVANSIVQFLLLVAPLFVLLITELLNSALESAVDRIGPEHHVLSGQSKDMGSAAVFIALLFAICTWALILIENYA